MQLTKLLRDSQSNKKRLQVLTEMTLHQFTAERKTTERDAMDEEAAWHAHSWATECDHFPAENKAADWKVWLKHRRANWSRLCAVTDGERVFMSYLRFSELGMLTLERGEQRSGSQSVSSLHHTELKPKWTARQAPPIHIRGNVQKMLKFQNLIRFKKWL